jgi:hypothetical protein
MNRHPLARPVALAVLFAGAAAACADAQTRPQSRERDVVVLSVSADASAEDNGRSAASDVRGPEFQGTRSTSSLQATIGYSELQHQSIGWLLSASGSVLHYASLHETVAGDQRATAGLVLKLGKKTRIDVSENLGYLPNYALASLLIATPHGSGGDAQSLADQSIVQSTTDHAIVRAPSYSTSTAVTLTQNISRRSTLNVSYGEQRRAFLDGSEPDLTNANIGARYGYLFTKYMGVHIGFARRYGQFDLANGAKKASIDDIDFGLDYNRTMGVAGSQRTTVNFATGSSLTGEGLDRRFTLTGIANLDHRFSQTGHLGLVYQRSVRFVDGFGSLVFADTVTGSASSRVASRVSLGASAGFAHGQVGYAQGVFDNWDASGRVVVALTQTTMAYAEYAWNRHAFDNAAQLLENVPGLQSRQTIHAGITVGVPLVRERVRERN